MSPRRRFAWVDIAFAVVMAVFWATLGTVLVDSARRHDFLNLYVGATLAGSGRFAELYDQQTQLELERRLVPSTTELIPFVRPHFYAIVLTPLSWLPLDAALHAWIALHVVLLVGCWAWAGRRFGSSALILGSQYLPTALGIAHGQDGVLLLVIAIAAYELAGKRKDAGAGAVLALGLMKFHLLFLVPVAMSVTRRWKMLWGYVAAATGLVLISASTGGVDGMMQYVRLLQAKELRWLLPSPELMVNIHSVGINFGVDHTGLTAGLLLLVVGLMAVAVWRAALVAAAGGGADSVGDGRAAGVRLRRGDAAAAGLAGGVPLKEQALPRRRGCAGRSDDLLFLFTRPAVVGGPCAGAGAFPGGVGKRESPGTKLRQIPDKHFAPLGRNYW